MSKPIPEGLWELLPLLFRPHPWHGISVGDEAPDKVTAYIEIVPTDPVKYELDKTTGYLKIDRPQKFSNVYPTLYGFIPQTYCGEENAAFCAQRTKREGIVGDGDPLDVCVLSEKADLPRRRPDGRDPDRRPADDRPATRPTTRSSPSSKGTPSTASCARSTSCPPALVDRLKHYFLTYKQAPDSLAAAPGARSRTSTAARRPTR